MRSKSEAVQALVRQLRQLVAMNVDEKLLTHLEAQNQFANIEIAIGERISFKQIDDVSASIGVLMHKVRDFRGNSKPFRNPPTLPTN
jgi:hypothetical protein